MWLLFGPLLFFLFWLLFPIIGARMARRRHRDAALWALICFFLPLVGILMLAIAGDAHNERGASAGNSDNGHNRWIRWQALIDVDPDIRAAATRVRAFGSQYEEQLAEKYLALNDKKFLPALVEKTLEDAGYVEPSPEPQPASNPQLRAERPAPPPTAPRATTERTQAIAPPPQPTPAPQAYRPAQPERPRQKVRSSAPKQASAGAVQGKIRNSVYRQNPDGSYMIIKGKHAGRSFKSFEEMRRTMR